LILTFSLCMLFPLTLVTADSTITALFPIVFFAHSTAALVQYGTGWVSTSPLPSQKNPCVRVRPDYDREGGEDIVSLSVLRHPLPPPSARACGRPRGVGHQRHAGHHHPGPSDREAMAGGRGVRGYRFSRVEYVVWGPSPRGGGGRSARKQGGKLCSRHNSARFRWFSIFAFPHNFRIFFFLFKEKSSPCFFSTRN